MIERVSVLLLIATGVVALLLPVVTVALPATVRIPRSKNHRTGAPPAVGAFSHVGHQSLRCYQCHPALFPQALQAFTHADMDAGRFCGGCHDGTSAQAVTAFACDGCHVP